MSQQYGGLMDDYNSFLHGNKLKKYYYKFLFIIALLISLGVYIFFNFQPEIYKSSGKFAVFYGNKTENTTTALQTNTDLTKSIAETAKSRYFLEKLSVASGVEFNSDDLDNNIDNIIKSNVVTNSNILNIELYDKNPDNLDKINKIFLTQLNSSKIISGSNSLVTIQTIDPLFTLPEPTYPKPLTYAIVAFVIIFFSGLLIIYSSTPQ